MARFRVSHNIGRLNSKLSAKIRNLDKEVDVEIGREAFRTHAELTADTPRRYTGNTRKGWKVRTMGRGWRRVENKEKVMFWLEEGTRRRVPKSSKNLFIPLRASAWRAGGYKKGMRWGQDFVFAKSARGIKPLKLIPAQARTAQRRIGKSFKRLARI